MIGELFAGNEVRQEENFYIFERRKKLVTFVPSSHIENLIKRLSQAGAGIIGNYEMCSFRSQGTGTFRPNSKANPFLGNRNKMSSEEEFRLEMECTEDSLNQVIDMLLSNHPYEEVAYEIYEFAKREKKISGIIYRLRKPIQFGKILNRMNRIVSMDETGNDLEIKNILATRNELTKQVVDSAKLSGCDLIIRKLLKPKKFELLITQL
jgi:hypothetical protein